MYGGTFALGLGVLASIAFSAFFSLTEAALLSVNRIRLRYLGDRGDARAKLALGLLHRPARLLTTILIGNTIVNIVASVLTTALALELLQSYALSIAAGSLTLLLLVFGEVTPKTFANEHAEWTALHVARPIRFFVVLFRPIEVAFSYVAKVILRLTGGSRMKPAQFHTQDEIKVLLRMGRERGHIGPAEDRLIRAVFEFNALELGEIMHSGKEIVSVRPDEPLKSIPQLVAKTGHSRFPVVEPAGNRILGLLYVKDLLFMASEQLSTLTAQSLLRAIPHARRDARVAEVLERMQADGDQMVAVVDDLGNLEGIVTIEDLLEEIVGDIADEYEVARRRLANERARIGALRIAAREQHLAQPASASEEVGKRPG